MNTNRVIGLFMWNTIHIESGMHPILKSEYSYASCALSVCIEREVIRDGKFITVNRHTYEIPVSSLPAKMISDLTYNGVLTGGRFQSNAPMTVFYSVNRS